MLGVKKIKQLLNFFIIHIILELEVTLIQIMTKNVMVFLQTLDLYFNH